MKDEKQKELILSLLKDDLVNAKLVNALNDIGLNADYYFLNLSETIFKLMGFDTSSFETDTIYEHYLYLSESAKQIDISKSRQQFDQLALEIYNELLLRKS